jgi:CHAT domain-containing protein
MKLFGEEHDRTAAFLYNLGEFYGSVMNLKDTAVFYKKMAVNVTQSIRTRITSLDKDLQKSFVVSKEKFYHSLADLLVEQGRIHEAQQVLAMLKEEEYFDFIRRNEQDDPRGTTVSYTPREQEQADRFQKIGEQLVRLSEEKRSLLKNEETGRESEEIDGALEAISQDLFAFFRLLETSLVTEHQATEVGTEFLEDIRKTLRDMGHDVALVHTLIAPTHVWLILTTADTQIHVKKELQQRELFEKIKTFRDCLEERARNPLPAARDLYDVLIAPISGELKKAGAQTLMFYLDGPLRYVPMSAMHDGELWLAEKYTVVVYTDAAKEKLRDRHETSVRAWEAAALGVSEAHAGFSALPAVKGELESIVRINGEKEGGQGIIPGIILMDEDFTAKAFTDALNQNIPVVHVASHFKLEPGNVTNSYLLLGDGAHLTLEQIRGESFRFEKVDHLTLSACNTAIELKEGAGREMEGLGVLAQKKGADSVIATLWPINDNSTGVFMPRFYELLQKEGVNKAEALRQTQVEFIEGKLNESSSPLAKETRGALASSAGDDDDDSMDFPGYSHPFFWAPFILMGNWL